MIDITELQYYINHEEEITTMFEAWDTYETAQGRNNGTIVKVPSKTYGLLWDFVGAINRNESQIDWTNDENNNLYTNLINMRGQMELDKSLDPIPESGTLDIVDLPYFVENATALATLDSGWDDKPVKRTYSGFAGNIYLTKISTAENRLLEGALDAIYENIESINFNKQENSDLLRHYTRMDDYSTIDKSLDPPIALDTDNEYYVEFYEEGKFKIKTMNANEYNTLKATDTITVLVEKQMQIVNGKRVYSNIS